MQRWPALWAPGFAPVFDSCGLAGGLPVGSYNRANPPPEGISQSTTGLDLPELEHAHETWAAGSTQEVAWGINANHGGGYSYR